ncbi:MAG: oxygen-independent coproporphyrinogen III oxidase [Paracoccaceae bacterium]
MKDISRLKDLGLFAARVPRYTSYPTAPVFSPNVGNKFQSRSLAALDPTKPVSVYIHIPFCERLCWFCACRTQGTQTLSPVENYIETIEHELEFLLGILPDGLRMGRLHWGGGTPTILPPRLIHRLSKAIKAVIPPADSFEFSVEIDPTLVDAEKIQALASQGMNRASIGIQDFDPEVQAAIGREQPFEVTKACVSELRAAGINSLNTDLVYGLPHQTEARLADTIEKVLTLRPDRVALFGYAHVPWVAKRQKLIDEAVLPDDLARYTLAELASAHFQSAGLARIGIDHFAVQGDELQTAAKYGRLRRNFQGYTADDCSTLIGLGASSISRLPEGYVQNAAATPAYTQRISDDHLAGTRGHILSNEDNMRASAIEMLMCNFQLDRAKLQSEFGTLTHGLDSVLAGIAECYGDLVSLTEHTLTIHPDGHALTRIIASAFDAYVPEGVRYSQAS